MTAPTKRPPVLTDQCRCHHQHKWHVGDGQCIWSNCPCKRYTAVTS